MSMVMSVATGDAAMGCAMGDEFAAYPILLN